MMGFEEGVVLNSMSPVFDIKLIISLLTKKISPELNVRSLNASILMFCVCCDGNTLLSDTPRLMFAPFDNISIFPFDDDILQPLFPVEIFYTTLLICCY